MRKSLIWNPYLLTFGVPIAMLLSLVLLARSSWVNAHPEQLSFALTLDFLLTVPLVYFLLIRGKNIPSTTVVPVFVLGIVLGSLFLPAENQELLNRIKHWVLPVVELGVFAVVLVKVRKAMKSFKEKRSASPDFFSTVKQVSAELLPKKVAGMLATEIAVFYYGFFAWPKRKLKPGEFSYHKKSGTISLLAAFLFLILMETFIVHILIQRWSPLAAWVLTLLTVYSGIQLFGIMRSFAKRPFSIDETTLNLRYGLLGETSIPLEDIDSFTASRQRIEVEGLTQKLSPLKEFESHNFILTFKREQDLHGFYGSKKRFTTLALHVDDPKRFAEELNVALSRTTE